MPLKFGVKTRRDLLISCAALACSLFSLAQVHTQRSFVMVEIPATATPLLDSKNRAGGTDLIVDINAAALQRIVILPSDVQNVSLTLHLTRTLINGNLSVRGPAQRKPDGVLGLDDPSEEPLVSAAKIDYLFTGNGQEVVTISGLGDMLRSALRDSKSDVPILLHAPSDAFKQQNVSASIKVSILSHPRATLFKPHIRPRPGVYAENRSGHLFYGRERLRLWGCVRPQTPNAETADRIASMGFNAIRMWGPRANDAPGAGSPLINDDKGEFRATKPGDHSPLDEYDRFYAEAKRDGLFIMSTGLTDMPHVSADSEWLKGDSQDWGAWQSAMRSKPDAWILNFAAAFDARLYRARQQQIKDYLTHVNPYTGKDYAHEEGIAIYELANESAHVKRSVERGFDKWPPFFASELQRRWNDWLRMHYGGDASLVKAWTKLDQDESLEGDRVKLEPIAIHKDRYAPQRAEDFIRFLVDLDNNLNEHLKEYARTFAPKGVGVAVVPFSFDTQYMPSNVWLYDNTHNADTASFGMYFWSLQDPLIKPPVMYLMDSSTVENKITVIYETMDGRPDPYRSAYPYRLAALAGWQDWDAIFFHYWEGVQDSTRQVPEEQYLVPALSYISPTHYWTAVYYDKDPALLSPMAIAGQIFLQGAIKPAPRPLTYMLGKKSIFDMSALTGMDVADVTYSQGARVRFDPGSDSATTILDRSKSSAVEGEILWDWKNGRLIIDTPIAKAYVGKPNGTYRFRDGIVVGGFADSFVSFGMISMDGHPLAGAHSTRSAYISAVKDARNTGFHMHYDQRTDPMPTGGPLGIGKLIDKNGHPPIVVDRTPYQVWFPRDLHGRFTVYDLARRKRGEALITDGHLQFSGGEAYISALAVTNPGSRFVSTPKTTTGNSFETQSPSIANEAAGTSNPAFAVLWNPLPGIRWNDNIATTNEKLRRPPFVNVPIAIDQQGIHLTRTNVLFGNSSDIDVNFLRGRMISIDVTFLQPPPLEEVIDAYDRQLGPSSEKRLANSEDLVTTVTWMQRHSGSTLSVSLTETQGTLTISYSVAD
jgi:hypothetical protein